MIKSENIHRTNITVRGYELDSYGHVNNAVYIQYLEQGRWEFMKDMNFLGSMHHDKLFLVVIETNIRYLREAVLFDELVIETQVKIEKPYLVFHHRILNKTSGDLLSRASVKTIFINKQRIPLDIPGFIQKFMIPTTDE